MIQDKIGVPVLTDTLKINIDSWKGIQTHLKEKYQKIEIPNLPTNLQDQVHKLSSKICFELLKRVTNAAKGSYSELIMSKTDLKKVATDVFKKHDEMQAQKEINLNIILKDFIIDFFKKDLMIPAGYHSTMFSDRRGVNFEQSLKLNWPSKHPFFCLPKIESPGESIVTEEKQRRYQFYNKGKFTDVEIKLDNITYRAHKLELAVSSEYFEKMLCSDMKEAQVSVIDFKFPTSVKTLNLFMDYVYLKDIPNETKKDIEALSDLMLLADQVQSKSLKALCGYHLKFMITTDNLLNIADVAVNANHDQLIEYCKKAGAFFIEADHFDHFDSSHYNFATLLKIYITASICNFTRLKKKMMDDLKVLLTPIPSQEQKEVVEEVVVEEGVEECKESVEFDKSKLLEEKAHKLMPDYHNDATAESENIKLNLEDPEIETKMMVQGFTSICLSARPLNDKELTRLAKTFYLENKQYIQAHKKDETKNAFKAYSALMRGD